MAVKLYGHTRSFDDGQGEQIILSCNARLFVLYKDIIGIDLLVDFASVQDRQAKLEQEITKYITKQEYEKFTVVQAESFCKSKKIKVDIYENYNFLTKLVLIMYLNSLSEQDRAYAIANQEQCLPIGFALRADVASGAIELLTDALVGKKKE